MLISGVIIHSIWNHFFFNDTATTEIYTLSLHDALPISCDRRRQRARSDVGRRLLRRRGRGRAPRTRVDRKSTRLNSSHDQISYAVFCLKKKKNAYITTQNCASSERPKKKPERFTVRQTT